FVDKRRIKLLLVPYLLWLLFATYLSISVLILN
ncbi:tryptophan-rich sensory protein, partial [Leuconostoc suionicum]